MSNSSSSAEQRPRCFIISEIGEEGSPERRRADAVYKYIIAPVAEQCGYEPVRADRIHKPGLITNDIISHLLNDEMVVADLSNNNPNVFYELAVRHAAHHPVVVLRAPGQRIPFDVHGIRAVTVAANDIEVAEEAKNHLRRHIEEGAKNPQACESPISVALDLDKLRRGREPLQMIGSLLEDIKRAIVDFQQRNAEILDGLLRLVETWPRGTSGTPSPVPPEAWKALETLLGQRLAQARQQLPDRDNDTPSSSL